MAMATEFLLATIRGDSVKPSLFDLFILDQMENNVKPGVRHVVYSFVEWIGRPELLEKFELYYFFLESYFNWKFLTSPKESSFVESIRSYKRVNASDNNRLTNNQKIGSIAYVLLVPQFIAILNKYSAKVREQRRQRTQTQANNDTDASTTSISNRSVLTSDSGSSESTSSSISDSVNTTNNTFTTTIQAASQYSARLLQYLFALLQSVFQLLVEGWAEFHPYCVTTLNIVVQLNRLLYTLNVVEYHHPLFGLLDMKLIKDRGEGKSATAMHNIHDSSSGGNSNNETQMSPQGITVSSIIDYILGNRTLTNNNDNNSSNSAINNSNNNSSSSSSVVSPSTIFFTLIFAAKLAQHFTTNSAELSSQSLSNKLMKPRRVPKPPQPPEIGIGCIIPPSDTSLCPICRKTRTNPCAASSGFVYCYLCIINALREKGGVCPVTKIPCKESQLIRIYEEHL